jgi:hypothetical protein
MIHVDQHPAYTDPSCPTNQLIAYLADSKATENWASPAKVAEVIYMAISEGVEGANGGKGGIPLRLPLGADSWGLQKADLEAALKEFEVLKPVSLSTSSAELLASVGFLQKK